MSENPTSDEIDENDDAELEQRAEQSADKAGALDDGGYGGPGPENETGNSEPAS